MLVVAAANCGFRKNRRSSMGSSTRSSHNANNTRIVAANPNENSVSAETQPRVGASMIEYTNAPMPRIDNIAPTRSSDGSCSSLARRDQEGASDQGKRDNRDVGEEDRTPPEVLEQPTAAHTAERGADTREASPDGDGSLALVGRKHVGENGQRRGHDQRRTDAHRGPGGDELTR